MSPGRGNALPVRLRDEDPAPPRRSTLPPLDAEKRKRNLLTEASRLHRFRAPCGRPRPERGRHAVFVPGAVDGCRLPCSPGALLAPPAGIRTNTGRTAAPPAAARRSRLDLPRYSSSPGCRRRSPIPRRRRRFVPAGRWYAAAAPLGRGSHSATVRALSKRRAGIRSLAAGAPRRGGPASAWSAVVARRSGRRSPSPRKRRMRGRGRRSSLRKPCRLLRLRSARRDPGPRCRPSVGPWPGLGLHPPEPRRNRRFAGGAGRR